MNSKQRNLHKILCESINDIIGFNINEDYSQQIDDIQKQKGTNAIKNAKTKIMQQLEKAVQANASIKNGSNDSSWNAKQETLSDVAERLGINLDFNQTSYNNRIASTSLDEITKAIQEASIELNKYVTSNGSIKFNKMKEEMPQEHYNYLLRMKDTIDRLSLSYLYDTKNAAMLTTGDERYGIKYQYDDNRKVIGVDTSNFDLNTDFEKNAESWGKQGTRKDSLKGKSKEEIQALYKASIVERYVNAKYGMNVEIPSEAFTIGNNKLPNDTLVINFTSAYRCPAWNECLVKYACYASGTERGYIDSYRKNTRLNLMWEAGRRDPELMKALFQMVRAYLVDYRKLTSLINKKGREEFAEKQKQQTQQIQQIPQNQDTNVFSEARRPAKPKYKNVQEVEIYDTPLTEYADILQEHKTDILRATKVRLNENGDFIGQWLLDAWDEFSGELKSIGVSTTAYTCRNLQFGKLKNIIINASKMEIGMGQGENGKAANVISKYFYAIPAKAYDEYQETYGDGKGNLVDKPLLYTAKDDFGATQDYIHVHALPLVDPTTGKPTGGYYYKCPCERLDVSPDGNPLKIATIKKGKNAGKPKINKETGKPEYQKLNCFNCRMCYQDRDKNTIVGYPGSGNLYVFVRLHGKFTDEFNDEVAKKIRSKDPQYGVPQNYFEMHKNKPQQVSTESNDVQKIVEDMMPNIVQTAQNKQQQVNTMKEGIKHVTRHAIGSMNAKLSGMVK